MYVLYLKQNLQLFLSDGSVALVN